MSETFHCTVRNNDATSTPYLNQFPNTWQAAERIAEERSQEHGRGIHTRCHMCVHVCSPGGDVQMIFHVCVYLLQPAERIADERPPEYRRGIHVRPYICTYIFTQMCGVYVGLHTRV